MSRPAFFAFVWAILAFPLLCAGAVQVSAQPAPPSVTAFLANPAQILKENPNGGAALAAAIQDLAVSDPATLPVIVGLLATANEAQGPVIGSALAQAAKIIVTKNQAYAAQIQQSVAASGNQVVIAAFTGALGDVRLGGVGSGFGGSGVGGGSGGQTSSLGQGSGQGTGAAQNIGSRGVNTTQFTFSSSVSSTSGRPSSSVSP